MVPAPQLSHRGYTCEVKSYRVHIGRVVITSSGIGAQKQVAGAQVGQASEYPQPKDMVAGK